jgi:hypothetical protein
MFANKNNRHITRGANETVNINLQLLLWNLIDILKRTRHIELDYLQIFTLRRELDFIIIEHSQEVPEYRRVYRIELEGVVIDSEIKVYIIDSGEYSTMLLPEEY